MTHVREQIRADLTAAMKQRDQQRTGTLRMLMAAIQTAETTGTKHTVDDAEVLQIIAREIKKRRESAEIYTKAGREELAAQELAEAEVLAGYQPQQLDDAELEALVADVIAQFENPSMRDMGQIMKAANEKAAGRVDGKRLSTQVRQVLSTK
ncbi:MAG: GatB/YqeY domain-containing protein [Corynebacterium sp.]|nr:GatB/YqeY domain-containing protein [Corynebacterium sp.]